MVGQPVKESLSFFLFSKSGSLVMMRIGSSESIHRCQCAAIYIITGLGKAAA